MINISMENNILYDNIKKNFNTIVDLLEQTNNQSPQKLVIADRELSGNKINGGKITNFSSAGIKDTANNLILEVSNKGIKVQQAEIHEIISPVTVNGDFSVKGEIFAEKLSVNELTADIRLEKSTPLAFKAENESLHGLGIIWTGVGHTKQFVYRDHDKFWCSENIDLAKNKSFKIDDLSVLTFDTLGISVLHSSLKTVGVLEKLEVEGSVAIDGYFFWDANTQRLGIGTEEPNGLVSLKNIDHEFVIDPTIDKKWKIGCWTTAGLDIVTDNTARIQIDGNGTVTIKNKTVIDGKLGIGLRNFTEDADLTTAGPVRFQNKKFEVAENFPTVGNYIKGDIVWNTNPSPTNYIGWVCTRTGTPGEWKAFGLIQQ